MKSLVCKEWEVVGLEKGSPEADRLHYFAERAGKRLHTTVLTRTHRGLEAAQVVGVLKVPGCSLEILPKISDENGDARDALVRMLAVACDIRVDSGELAALKTQRDDLLDLLARLFAERLLTAVRRGLPRRYVAHEEDLNWLRGRLDMKRQTTRLAARPDILACRFDELSEDTPLNRVLKAAVGKLTGAVRSAATARLFGELAARFEFVPSSGDPLREPVRLDRTNAAFHDLHQLAQLFLLDEWQSTTAGHRTGFALLFPMEKLFEKFVVHSLRRAFGPRVVKQRGERYALKGGKREIFKLVPDALIDDGAVVLDAKWKLLKHDDEKLGIAPADVYQMLAYARAWKAKRLILLYPQGVGRFERRWKVNDETGCLLDVVTVDVGKPDEVVEELRRIVEPVDDALRVAAQG